MRVMWQELELDGGIYTVGYMPGVGVVCINNMVWVDREEGVWKQRVASINNKVWVDGGVG